MLVPLPEKPLVYYLAESSPVDCRMPEAIPWRLVPLDASGLATHSQRSLPDATTGSCELCGRRPRQPLSTVLVIDGPDGLAVPFLICAECRRALDELHALLESAAKHTS
jgi:hypothetical protein